jgi:hypothetical protein
MGEKSMKHKEIRKMKKSDVSVSVSSTYQKPITVQPELIRKKKKPL